MADKFVHEKTGLVADWVNGNHSDVIRNLSQRHPAIAVTMIVQGAQDGDLGLNDCNSIANMLMDDFMEIRDTKGLEATGRPV